MRGPYALPVPAERGAVLGGILPLVLPRFGPAPIRTIQAIGAQWSLADPALVERRRLELAAAMRAGLHGVTTCNLHSGESLRESDSCLAFSSSFPRDPADDFPRSPQVPNFPLKCLGNSDKNMSLPLFQRARGSLLGFAAESASWAWKEGLNRGLHEHTFSRDRFVQGLRDAGVRHCD